MSESHAYVRLKICGGTTMISEIDRERASNHSWQLKPTAGGKFYVQGYVGGKVVRLHRFILGLTSDDRLEVDHINQDGTDNRRENLRLCTHGENCRNSPKRIGKSKYRGVARQSSGRFYSHIKVNGVYHHCGTFDTEAEAAEAYNEAAKRLHGEFAVLNEVSA